MINRTMICLYGCGWSFTPTTQEEANRQALEHSKTCPKHPLRKMEQELAEAMVKINTLNKAIHKHRANAEYWRNRVSVRGILIKLLLGGHNG